MRFFKTPNFVVKCATSAPVERIFRQEHPGAVEIKSHLVDREHVSAKNLLWYSSVR